jgi:DNA-binding NarL/FixJ family response regulator
MELIRVSIVEDVHEIREGFRDVLNSSPGYVCIAEYANAEDAVAQVMPGSADIIVMDINLPGISGIECIRRLREKGFKGHFLMFTVYDDDESVFQALQAGAMGYLLKKSSPTQFLDSIREIMEGGSPMSAQIARKLVNVFNRQSKPTQETDVLSKREREILELISKGFLYKEVAEKLFITTGTVKQHIHKIYEKLQVQNKTEAINKYFNR